MTAAQFSKSDEILNLGVEYPASQNETEQLITNAQYATQRIAIDNGLDRYLFNKVSGSVTNYVERISNGYLSTVEFEAGLNEFYPPDELAFLPDEHQIEVKLLYLMQSLNRDSSELDSLDSTLVKVAYIKRLIRLELIPEEKDRIVDDESTQNFENLYPLPSVIPHEITLLHENQIFTQQKRFFVNYMRSIEAKVKQGAVADDLSRLDQWVLHNCGYYGITQLKIGSGIDIDSFKGSTRKFDLTDTPTSYMPSVFLIEDDSAEKANPEKFIFVASDHPVNNPTIVKRVLSNFAHEIDYSSIASIVSEGMNSRLQPKRVKNFVEKYLDAYASNIRYSPNGDLISSGVDLIISLYDENAKLNGKPFTKLQRNILQVFGVAMDSHKIALERHIAQSVKHDPSLKDRDMTKNILNDFLQSIFILV